MVWFDIIADYIQKLSEIFLIFKIGNGNHYIVTNEVDDE